MAKEFEGIIKKVPTDEMFDKSMRGGIDLKDITLRDTIRGKKGEEYLLIRLSYKEKVKPGETEYRLTPLISVYDNLLDKVCELGEFAPVKIKAMEYTKREGGPKFYAAQKIEDMSKKVNIKKDLYKEFKAGEVLYDVNEGIDSEEAYNIADKYYECVCNSNGKYDRIDGISKLNDSYIFKLGSSYNSFVGTIVKHSIDELETRLEAAHEFKIREEEKKIDQEKEDIQKRIKEGKKNIQRQENTKEKYLIVSKVEKNKISKIQIFKDSDLDQNLETLKKYEDMTEKRFAQEIKYLDKTQLGEEQKRVKIMNKKIRDKDFER